MSSHAEEPSSRAGSLPLVGGVLALDFCNTSSGRGTSGHVEHIVTIDHLVSWARHAAILDDQSEARLRAIVAADPELAARFLKRSLDVRDAIYKINATIARARKVDQADIDVIANTHAACLTKGRLTTLDGTFGWSWQVESAPEEVVLGPIVASAMALITAADHGRLKQCEGHNCGWLFIDTTKSSNRRWCEMDPCGNRAKQKRRRGRLRAEEVQS
jgi:predicted RNA-binding Zn ribbon-like protein